MYYQLSLVIPPVVLVLLGKPVQGFINLIFFLSSIVLIAFADFEQGLSLYLISVLHAILLIFLERRSKLTRLFNQLADKIING